MPEESGEGVVGGEQHACPEPDCGLESFNSQTEVKSHLKWDHNRSEARANAMVEAGGATGFEERVEQLDEITIDDYPYRVDLDVAILADPDNKPEEWAEAIQSFVEGQLSNVPCVVEAEVTERDTDD